MMIMRPFWFAKFVMSIFFLLRWRALVHSKNLCVALLVDFTHLRVVNKNFVC
jgi:hypothetical protein